MKNKSKFTLIELLTVVTIIAILVALLLPALFRTRRLSKRVVCMNNLKQAGAAFAMYLNDSGGIFPVYTTDYWMPFGDPQHDSKQTTPPLNQYLGNNYEIACQRQGDTGTELMNNWGDTGSDTCWQARGASYQTLHARTTPDVWCKVLTVAANQKSAALKVKKISSPTNKIISGDDPFLGSRPFSKIKNRWHSPDKRKYNILFADFHVEYFHFPMEIESWVFRSTADPSYDWW